MKQEPTELKFPMSVICINANNKPIEIPQNKWLIEQKTYTAIAIVPTLVPGKFGFVLEEIKLDESCYPYKSFSIERFGIPVDDLAQADEAVKELMKEIELEPIEI